MTEPNIDELASALAEKIRTKAEFDLSPKQIAQIAKKLGAESRQDQFADGLASLLSKSGSTENMSVQLYHQTYSLREKVRDLEAKLETAEKSSLSDEDAALLKAAKEVGDIGAMKTQLTEAQQKLKAVEVGDRRRKAASAEGYNADVLAGIAGLSGFDFAVEKVKGEDGKEIEAGFLIEAPKAEGEQPTKHRMSEYIQKNHAPFVPALKAESNGAPPSKQHPGDKKTKDRGTGGAKALQEEILADIKTQHTGPEDRTKMLAERLGQTPAMR